jgi:hypothetical protein
VSVPNITTDPLMTVMKAAGRARVPVLLWGAPGIGKSSTIEGLATSEGLPLETVVAALRDPSDFAGLPIVTDNGVTMEPPAWARRLAESENGGILFLDEISTAPPAVQAALLRVILEGVVGDLRLPTNVRLIAAANPPELAADGWDLSAPVANRFLHIDYAPTLDGWLDGMISGFRTPTPGRVFEPSAERTALARSQVAEFIRSHPLLADRTPGTDAASGRAWPSRRTWTMAADVLALLDPTDTDAALLAVSGLVGTGPATEFMAWRRTSDLPHPAAVLEDPSSVAWASLRPDHAWVILSSVVAYSTAKNTKTAWTAAWGPLAAAAEHNLGDIAAANVRTLMRARPTNANPPATARALVQVVTDAGLMTSA